MNWQNQFTSLALNKNDALPELLLTHLSSWSAISVAGADKKSYLQGQLTCDLVTLPEQSSTLGAHCDAKGKMWSIFRLFQHREQYALFQHTSGIEKALTELKKYSVFSKVEIALSDDIALGVMGTNADDFIDQLSDSEGDVRSIPGGSAVKVEPGRWLLLIDEKSAESLSGDQRFTLAHESVWDLADIRAAIPRLPASQQNEHIPQALNLQAINGINFSKGCYTGQETVARARYRGTNKRAMCILSGQLSVNPQGVPAVERSVGENWRSVGEFLTCYQYADGLFTGLIVLPNNLDADTRFRLSDYPGSELTLSELPYSLESEE